MIYSSTLESNLSHCSVTEVDVVLTTFSPVGATITASYNTIITEAITFTWVS